jgi:hypothetical protein
LPPASNWLRFNIPPGRGINPAKVELFLAWQQAEAGRVCGSKPAQACRALKTKMGASVFGQLYGKNATDKNAFGTCVSKAAQTQSQNELNASAACQTEETAGTQAFALKYGTNNDETNAFGK